MRERVYKSIHEQDKRSMQINLRLRHYTYLNIITIIVTPATYKRFNAEAN